MKKKKRVLKKWVRIAIAFIVILTIIKILCIGLKDYANYLEKCDIEKGYTCNIFGK